MNKTLTEGTVHGKRIQRSGRRPTSAHPKAMVVAAKVMPVGELRVAGLGVAPFPRPQAGRRGGEHRRHVQSPSSRPSKEAEMMADCKDLEGLHGITGSHPRPELTGMVIVRDKEVAPLDVQRVVETAKAINIPNDQRRCWSSRRNSSSTATRSKSRSA